MIFAFVAGYLLAAAVDSTTETVLSEKPVDGVRLAIVGTATAGTMIGLDIYQRNAWWSGQRGRFHVGYDWDYALWVDKIGHIYGGAILSDAFSSSLRRANVPKQRYCTALLSERCLVSTSSIKMASHAIGATVRVMPSVRPLAHGILLCNSTFRCCATST